MADQAWIRSGRSAGVRVTIAGAAPFWLGSSLSSLTILAGFSDTTPTTSCDWSWMAVATCASATTWEPLTSWTFILPPKLGGWAYSR